MTIKLKGMKEIEKALEQKYGTKKMRQITDEALLAGGQEIEKAIKINFESFEDTGASHDEVTASKPYTLNGVRTIKIHWKGPKNRYQIVHLNEFGTIKNPNPRGKGAIDRALRSGRDTYFKVVKRQLEKG
ncbi:hypothetical protein [Staphylococcus xylosus]|uniref:hypothetical protein n=1 Tax=Staphylococcus xylosus TaxID=1288 RepID=UPI001CDC49E3|nr:hypothetical protein [Staphylococcus xylosus]MCQ3816708.1 hypothetical protein [Staphylococcus xylosus]MCQ3819239.1 hypothetical protein [Staphylococcus xylosus]UBV36667.1 hypothetical protein JGY88_09390 [Staphylococcus xylosus]